MPFALAGAGCTPDDAFTFGLPAEASPDAFPRQMALRCWNTATRQAVPLAMNAYVAGRRMTVVAVSGLRETARAGLPPLDAERADQVHCASLSIARDGGFHFPEPRGPGSHFVNVGLNFFPSTYRLRVTAFTYLGGPSGGYTVEDWTDGLGIERPLLPPVPARP